MKTIIILLFLNFISLVVYASDSATLVFSTPDEEQQYHQLLASLRCPKCQNNSIADSNAMIASDMRLKVYQLLKAGNSPEQVRSYMIERYGNFVTYQPPVSISTLILWVGPALFFCVGLGVIIIRGRKKNGDNSVMSEGDQQRLAALLEKERSQE